MSEGEARRASVRYGTPNMEYIRRMATWPAQEDGPVFMVNLMKYRAEADYGDGSKGKTGREADDEYTPSEILRDIGAQIVFAGEVEQQLIGGEPRWDRIGIVKYPSRRAFLEMQRRGDFQAKHVHKEAGMEQTIVMAGLPQAVPAVQAATTVDPADPPFVMMHVLRFAPGGAALLAEYEATVRDAATELGIGAEAKFAVEGTVVGDGRSWDEVRFNRFPSHTAFRDLTARAIHQGAQAKRSQAIADSYTMMVKPYIDRLAESARELLG